MSLFRTKRIYLDYASAPPVSHEAEKAMRAAFKYVGNPGAIHREAVEAKRVLESARESVASNLGVKAREILFTSGLTESNNLAILGFAKQLERTKRSLEATHWIVSSIEHSSVLECFAEIERLGGAVTHIDPDARGIVSVRALTEALKKETVFVSIGWANNETGVIQPLREIKAALRAHEDAHSTEVIFHTDAGQAPLYLSTTTHSLGVDLFAIGSNKLYGPHGIGALYLSNRVLLAPTIAGGRQERGLRAGTENVALACGFAAAFELAAKERMSESRRLSALRDDFAKKLSAALPQSVVNGSLTHALPHMLNISIPSVSSEYVTLALDAQGIAVSTKSACREGEESRSHVIAACGGEAWRAENTLRFSLGRDTSASDLERVVHVLKDILTQYPG